MDAYKTLREAVGPVIFKERKSKFIGFAYPLSSIDEVKPILEALRSDYPNCNHVCYAFNFMEEQKIERYSDDGEPSNSAGPPIFGQLEAFGLTNVMVAVVRIFGGVKLGVGGLIQAYKESARLTLEEANICSRTLTSTLKLRFGYDQLDLVMRLIKIHQLNMVAQEHYLNCEITIETKKTDLENSRAIFESYGEIEIVD